MWRYRQLSFKLLFCDILRTICRIYLKCEIINVHKQRNQQAKYQHLGITSLNISHLLDKYLMDNFI